MRTVAYRLRFESPFLIASGVAAPGRFDAVSLLSDRVPYVPPSSIRGRVKAAMLQHCVENQGNWLKYRICEGQQGQAQAHRPYCQPDVVEGDYGICPLCRIFGIPGGEISKGFDFTGARIPLPVASLLQKLYETEGADAAYFRHSRNRRDYRLRRAREDGFFSLGLADPLLDLEGSVQELPLHRRYDLVTEEFDYALLLLALRIVTEIGGGRNRGYGRCRFLPKDADDAWRGTIEAHLGQWKLAKAQKDMNS